MPGPRKIVSWNVNGLYNTLKDASYRYSSVERYFTEILNADIICFQEAKIQEDKLEKWIGCVPGFESYWAFSEGKKGYSGVVTYIKEELLPLDAKADWLGDEYDNENTELHKEGRLMYTDHGNFVLLNVYVPNAGEKPERCRLRFKLEYLKALEHLCDEIVDSGKHVIVVGDFNIAHKQIDVHKKWNIENIYSPEERTWIDGFLDKYIDLYRYFHPDTHDVFSVWNQKSEARIHNEGLRIDFAVCDRGFVSQVLDVEIKKMFPKNWSDHAALFVMLKDMQILPEHPAPAISSCNMKRFQHDRKQKTLTSLFAHSSPKFGNDVKSELPLVSFSDDSSEQTSKLEGPSSVVPFGGSSSGTCHPSQNDVDSPKQVNTEALVELGMELLKKDTCPPLVGRSSGNKETLPSSPAKDRGTGKKRKAEFSRHKPSTKQKTLVDFLNKSHPQNMPE